MPKKEELTRLSKLLAYHITIKNPEQFKFASNTCYRTFIKSIIFIILVILTQNLFGILLGKITVYYYITWEK